MRLYEVNAPSSGIVKITRFEIKFKRTTSSLTQLITEFIINTINKILRFQGKDLFLMFGCRITLLLWLLF